MSSAKRLSIGASDIGRSHKAMNTLTGKIRAYSLENSHAPRAAIPSMSSTAIPRT